MQYVAGGIVELLLGELWRAPIGGLLLLRQLDAEKLAGEIFKAMAVGEGAGNPGGDLGAVDRLRHHPEIMLEHGEVETAEMEDLEHALVGEKALQLWRIIVAAELKQHSPAVAFGELHQAEPVAIGVKAKSLGVDGDGATGKPPPRQIALMQLYEWGLAQAWRILKRRLVTRVGAQEKTRTSTPFRALEPESSASTSSATWA